MSAHRLLDTIDLREAPRGSFVVEIGSVREPSDVPSSLYFSRKAADAGLGFVTVDFSEASWTLARRYVGEEAVLSDGVKFLETFSASIAVLYLDNFDYPFNEAHARALEQRCGEIYAARSEVIDRRRSTLVHLAQFHAAMPRLAPSCWVIVDNTHRSGLTRRLVAPFFGKGERVVPDALQAGFVIAAEGHGGVMLHRGAGPRPPARLRAMQLYCGGHRGRLLYRAQGLRPPATVGS